MKNAVAERQVLALFPRLPRQYKLLVLRAIETWNQSSGFSWTAARCKSVCQYLLKLRAGEEAVRPQWVSSKYLTYVERLGGSDRDKQIIELLQLWRMFTAFAPKELDHREVEKFKEAVRSPPNGGRVSGLRTEDPRCASRAPEITSLTVDLLPEVKLGGVVPVRNPMVLAMDRMGHVSDEFADLLITKQAVSHCLRAWAPDNSGPYALKQILSIPDDILIPLKVYRRCSTPGYFGHVHMRVQPDGKHRFFFAPPIWAQWMLAPWSSRLYNALRHIPEDCTYDQQRGVETIQKWLREGRDVHSVDLSSATDRFPLCITRDILLELSESPNMRMWVDTFCFLSRMPAKAGSSFDSWLSGNTGRTRSSISIPEVIQWKVGQPLGLIASFAAFAISHHALARWVTRFHERSPGAPGECEYVLLGDDIAFKHKSHADAYRVLLREIGVEVSDHKSLSGSLGEFAGRVITSSHEGFKSKWMKITLRSLPAAISVFGPSAIRCVPQSRLRDVISLLPTPRTPRGVNPGGFPKALVDEFLIDWYSQEEDVVLRRELRVERVDVAEHRIRALLPSRPYSDPRLYPVVPDAPIGAVGMANDFDAGPFGYRSERTSWHWKKFQSRSWLTRVRRTAQRAGLM